MIPMLLTVLASDVVAGDRLHIPGLTAQPLVVEHVRSRSDAGFRLAVITVWTAGLDRMVELAMSYDDEVDVTRTGPILAEQDTVRLERWSS